MPTPVSAARQCLTDEAARALDDAVAVARRRGHAQTTSLHAVSALLALPSSALRDACARARSSAYSPRLQFRALELSVGVSLDRLPSSKSAAASAADDGPAEPPVSNSLMAAIKRSQANQRRHPDSFHFHHQLAAANAAANSAQTAPILRVEMKHFVLSILDDPIVSRVLGEAGFRSCDIKLAILHPPVRHHQLSPYGRARCPPVFLCNLADSDRRGFGFSFPFARSDEGDENSRRIGEVLARKSGKNPLLLGACATEALKSFAEGLQSGKAGHLAAEINGISVLSIEKEVSEFVSESGDKDTLEPRLDEACRAIEQCSGRGSGGGVVLSIGDLKSLVGDGVVADRVSLVVSRLKGLLELHKGKLWLIGAAASHEVYSQFSVPFPSIDKDWDLHILPITSSSSSKASADGLFSKSSLMGSFVPFGGFFAAPSELKSPCSSSNQCFTRCLACTEKYEQEVASILKAGSTLSVASPYSESLPRLQMAELDTSKGLDIMKTKDGGTALSARISGLQKKWNEICQRLHHTQPGHKPDIFLAGSNISSAESFQGTAYQKESDVEDSPNANKTQSILPLTCTTTNLQTNFPSKQGSLLTMASESQKSPKVCATYPIEIDKPRFCPRPVQDMNLTPGRVILSTPVASVTTDLGLGTIYASTGKEQQTVKLHNPKICQPHFLDTHSTKYDLTSACASRQIIQSRACSVTSFRGQFDPRDIKSLKRVMFEKVGWQDEAISVISQAVCCSRSGGGRHRGSNLRGDIWLTFLGPDRVGKKRIALALAEILYGSRESLISVDLGFQDRGFQTHSIFEEENGEEYDLKFRGKTVVDYLAGELSRKHFSVVFLENVDKADLLVQSSLSQAIRTGKFPDSRGREISINNTLFVTTTTPMKGKTSHHLEKDIKFSEETIMAARRFQMQILNGSFAGIASSNRGVNVQIMPKEGTSNPFSVNKRKLIDTSDSTEEAIESQKRAQKASRSFLDLNVPLEEIEESADCGEYDSDSISESSEAWLEDFLDQVDEKVAMQPFDFDAHAAKIVEDITINVKRVFGPEATLQIDYNVMVQILGAAWLSEEKRAVEDWIEQVLCRGLAEAEKKYDRTSRGVMRLVSSGPLGAKEQTSCVCLPSRISIN